MAKLVYDIVGGYSKSEFQEFDPQELINMYVAKGDDDTKALFPRSGLSKKRAIGIDGAGRQIYAYPFGESFFAVVGQKIYSIDSLENVTYIGSLNTEDGFVCISDIQTQVMFVDGTEGWIYTVDTGLFSKITSVGFLGSPSYVASFANRFLVISDNKIQYSSIADGLTWNALDFFEMTSPQDRPQAMIALYNRLYIFGLTSLSKWYDSGDPDSPFIPDIPTQPIGCAAKSSVVSSLGVMLWLAKDSNGVGSIFMSTGGNPSPVSISAIENEIRKYTNISDASAFIYKNEIGHIFYVISFTDDNASWQFLVNSDLPLYERWSKIDYNLNYRWLAEKHAYVNGKHYTLGYNDFYLYEISFSYDDDAGVSIRRRRTGGVINLKTDESFCIGSLKITGRKGTGTNEENNRNPVLFLSISYDNGRTFGNVIKVPIGRYGETKFETIFYRLGYSNSFVPRIEHYNNSKVFITGSVIEMEKG